MATNSNARRLLAVVLIAWAIAGCASQGVEKKLTAGDANLLPGVWAGRVNPPGGTSMVPATLTINRDGTYTTSAGAFSTAGKAEIKDGFVQFFSTSGTGATGAGDRTGSAVVMDRDTSWGLVGSGHASTGGPFNFDFSKKK
jgi:heat shock protein HslJ